MPAAKGHFKDEKLAVTVDAGYGSGGTVTRVASGAYDIGFADLAALIGLRANNPTAVNTVTNVAWTAMDPPLRKTMLVRGDVDAITGFSFTSVLNLEARGIRAEDLVVLPYPSFGVKLYGNAVIVGEDFLKKNPTQ